MNRRIRPKATSAEDRFHRFLRPGALARLRDARIRPRSAASIISALPSPPSPPSQPDPAAAPGSPPCLSPRTFGPRFPQRKKLLAAKAITFFAAADDSPLDNLGTDLLVAH